MKWASWICPLERSATPDEAERYGCEPYAIAADIYSAPGYAGRGGWSWYTGTAGWWHRLVVEQLLGLRRRNGRLYIRPKLPSAWNECEVRYRTPGGVLHIRIERGDGAGAPVRILVDGQVLSDDYVTIDKAG